MLHTAPTELSNIKKFIALHGVFISRLCVVGIATTLRAGRSGVRIPVGSTDFFFFLQNVQLGFGAHPAPFSMDTFFPYRV